MTEAEVEATNNVKSGLGYSKLSRILGDTIACRKPPFTVGVYGEWGSGKTQMLHSVRERLEFLTKDGQEKRSLSVNIFSLLYRLFFFDPILFPPPQESKIIFVHFSIMDYAGSDKLWAGIITHISRSIDEAFGKWAVKIFRTWHYTPDLHLKPYLNTPKPGQKQAESGWKIAKWSSYIVPVLGLLLMALVVYCFVSFGIPDLTPISEAASEDIATTAVTAAVGIGISIKIIDAIKMVINLVVSQAARITSMSKKADFSTSLGFMAKVKTEIYYMTSVVQYMSILLQYDVKICLIIDDVDLLGKEKIMGLFKVVSLLQNSRNSRYIQILCMDPMIAASLIKKALFREMASNVNGHAFLRRNIQLPFHIPAFDDKTRMKILLSNNLIDRQLAHQSFDGKFLKNSKTDHEHIPLVEVIPPTKEQLPKKSLKAKLERYNSTLDKVLSCFRSHPLLMYFNHGNERSISRILLSTQFALRLRQSKHFRTVNQVVKIETLAAWITLVDQWPYRVSWIWQAIEDNVQHSNLDPHATIKFSDNALLHDIYELVAGKLTKPESWKTLLELDGDPECFVQMLKVYPITIKQLNSFLPLTTNLNRSIRRIICNAASQCVVQQSTVLDGCRMRWRVKGHLDQWTVDEVCEELDQIGINPNNVDKYKEIVKENDITGRILCECTRAELKEHFSMSLSDWVTTRKYLNTLKTHYGLNRRSFRSEDFSEFGLENDSLS